MDRVLTLEFVRVTEAAAVKAGRLMGKGDKMGADQLAVDGMHSILSTVPIDGTVVIGEGEMDEAPMLYIGEKVGAGGTEVDIAVDPLEGTNLTAKGQDGSIAVMAIARKGNLLHAPDMYMEKLCVGPRAKGRIDLTRPVQENLREGVNPVEHEEHFFVLFAYAEYGGINPVLLRDPAAFFAVFSIVRVVDNPRVPKRPVHIAGHGGGVGLGLVLSAA